MRVIEFVCAKFENIEIGSGFPIWNSNSGFFIRSCMPEEFLIISVHLCSCHWHDEIVEPTICIHQNRRASNKLGALAKSFTENTHWVREKNCQRSVSITLNRILSVIKSFFFNDRILLPFASSFESHYVSANYMTCYLLHIWLHHLNANNFYSDLDKQIEIFFWVKNIHKKCDTTQIFATTRTTKKSNKNKKVILTQRDKERTISGEQLNRKQAIATLATTTRTDLKNKADNSVANEQQ